MRFRFLSISGLFLLACQSCLAQEAGKNDGTDPTKPTSSATIAYEYLNPTDDSRYQSIYGKVNFALGKGTSLQLRAPFPSNNVLDNDDFGLGDVSVKLQKVFVRTKTYGFVMSGEVLFDTASRYELGAGMELFKLSAIYAKFLKGGHIFAPALLHTVNITDSDTRPDVNLTTLDLYFVPRLENPKYYMTLDPFINYSWEDPISSGGLAVTMGYKLGEVWVGNGQIYIKPQVFFGDDRNADWGAEVGFQLLGW
jgi:hypothetical protein